MNVHDVDRCIDELKTTYAGMRRRIRSEFRGLGNKYDEKFAEVARMLLKAGQHPRCYVLWVFDTLFKEHQDIYPNMVSSAKMCRSFLESRPERRRELEVLIGLQAQKVDARLRENTPLSEILQDETLPLSAVFRYAVACSVGNEELAKNFEAAADEMFLFEPLYRELLSQWLPEEKRHGQ